jgi:hypothetical protein
MKLIALTALMLKMWVTQLCQRDLLPCEVKYIKIRHSIYQKWLLPIVIYATRNKITPFLEALYLLLLINASFIFEMSVHPGDATPQSNEALIPLTTVCQPDVPSALLINMGWLLSQWGRNKLVTLHVHSIRRLNDRGSIPVKCVGILSSLCPQLFRDPTFPVHWLWELFLPSIKAAGMWSSILASV